VTEKHGGSGVFGVPRIPSQAWTWPVDRAPEVDPKPVYPSLHDGGWRQGAPIGGIGTGGIVQNCCGAFCRWTLKAGAVKYFCNPADMFSLRVHPQGGTPKAVALHPGHPAAGGEPRLRRALSAWNWDLDPAGCSYHVLFPKAWRRYPAENTGGVDVVCEQFSPVLPHDYRVSSYPVGLFIWHLTNTLDVPVRASVLFTFTNMVGWFNDFDRGRPVRKNGGNTNRATSIALPDGQGRMVGVVMLRDAPETELREGLGQFCVAALADERRSVSFLAGFDPGRDGADVWNPFVETGALPDSTDCPRCVPQQEVAAAVCVQVDIAPGETIAAPMVLAWDLPIIAFGSGREHLRRYTRFFGADGTHAAEIAAEALLRAPEWSDVLDAWHRTVTERSIRPDWYYAMLFNEGYLLVDGLTVWTDGARNAPGLDPFFAIIECPDYPYYCTLDLWVYGSFLLLEHWPELEKNVIRRFARFILHEDAHLRRCPHTGRLFPSKEAGAAPHDFGEPQEDPPVVCNSYVHQNSNRWKDLNCQFVLTLYRDVLHLDDSALLEDSWPAVKAALQRLAQFDEDGDGLIENDGTPDQTMDNIPMKGVSCYCGGLWLAALHAALRMAERCGDDAFVQYWRRRAEKARESFDRRLWNGAAYRFDTDGESPDALFIDALFGVWYGRLCGLRNLVPEAHYRATLRRIYERNVRDFHGGRFGGANITGWGRGPHAGEENEFQTRECQVSEVLYGLNVSFAALLLDAGMEKEAFDLLHTLYSVVYERFGLFFRSPAAWTPDGRFRAIMNLRPLVIWAFEFQG